MDLVLEKALKVLETADLVAVDTETDGLNTRTAKCIGLGFAVNTETGFYFSNITEMIQIVNALAGKRLLAWNAYFDLEIIRNQFNVDLWSYLHADVLLLKHTVEEEPPFKLKEVAAKVFGHDATAEQEELKKSIKKNGGKPTEFYKADTEVIAKYCIQDCKLTFRLFQHYLPILHAENLTSFFFTDEVMPLYTEVTRFMQSRGIPVDVIKTQNLLTQITNDINDLEDRVQTAIKPHLKIFNQWIFDKEFKVARSGTFAQNVVGISRLPIPKVASGKFSLAQVNLNAYRNNPWIAFLLGLRDLSKLEIQLVQSFAMEKKGSKYTFNLNSKHHLKKLFFGTLNEKPLTTTKLGNPQVDDDFIEAISEKYEWASWLSDFNKLQKLKSSYLERILEKHEDGIFYPQFKQHGTISGRYGSDLQQLPRIAEEGQFSPIVMKYRNEIRTLFIAGPEHKFVDADYESLEPHIFAHVSGDDLIKNIFRNGDDFYSTIAIRTERLKDVSANKEDPNYLGNKNKGLRQRAKAYSLGIPYGMESYKLSKTLGISQEEAEKLINNYLTGFPDLAKWMKRSNEAVAECGYIKSEAGRIRHFPAAKALLYKFGPEILDSLELWKQYADDPSLLAEMKDKRWIVKNAMNNAKNFQIQSLAASITNRACIAIARDIKTFDAYIVAQIHDQIVVRCSKKNAEEVKKIVEKNMESVYPISIPLKAPAELGDNLAESH